VQRSPFAFAIFFAVITLVVGSVHYYLYSRLVRATELGPVWQRVGTIAVVVLALLTPLGMALSRVLGRPRGTVVAYVAYGWMGVAVLLLFLLAGSEIVRGAVYAWSVIRDQPADAGRRLFVSRAIAGTVGALALAIGGLGTASAVGNVELRRLRVGLKRLPEAMSGFKIVQLTDLHIGPTLGRDWLEGVVANANAAEPDLIAITGDLVDGSVADLREHVAPLGRLKAKHGVYFVTGNHEYYSGADEWIAELTRLGVRVLRNERVSIGDGDVSFDLAGVDDWSAKRFGNGHGADLARAVDGRDAARELVLLAHQPKQIQEASDHGVGLQLSGHTHGGQIFPWHFFVGLDQPYVAGLATHRATATQIYVSRGTGYWGPPMRVGAPSEISVLELFKA
jgi:hypothetical protein